MKHYSPIPRQELVDLVNGAKQGHEKEIARLMELSHEMVYLNALYLLKNKEDAEDMMQEVYLTVFTKLDTLKTPEAFFDWVKVICVNKCKNRLRQSNPMFLLENPANEEDEEDFIAQIPSRDDQCSPDKVVDTEETKQLILKCINTLPDAQRMCLILFYYNDFSIHQIAKLMEISAGTVKSRLAYGRRNLKKALEEEKLKGNTLYGRAPSSFLAYIAYFLKKTFPSEEALLAALSPSLVSSVTSGVASGADALLAASAADAALAKSAAVFVSRPAFLSTLSFSALWATTAGKVAIAALSGTAALGLMLGASNLPLFAERERAAEVSSVIIEELPQENSGTEDSLTVQESGAGEETSSEGSEAYVLTEESGDTSIIIVENGESSGDTSQETGDSSTESSEDTEVLSEIAILEAQIETMETNVQSFQEGYDQQVEKVQWLVDQINYELTNGAIAAGETLAIATETYNARTLANETSSGTFSEEEVAEAKSDMEKWAACQAILSAATLDDVRAQTFGPDLEYMNTWGQMLVTEEANLATIEGQLLSEQAKLAEAKARLAQLK